MSKWLNDLNVINLKLYMFHMPFPWGVMPSHIRSRGGKFLKASKHCIGHLNNS